MTLTQSEGSEWLVRVRLMVHKATVWQQLAGLASPVGRTLNFSVGAASYSRL